jgi:SpoVK/Ycf46/Vps4 family AAA+-type ATPase
MEKILLHKINNHENGNTDNKTVEIDGSHTNIINLSQILNIFDGLLERTGQIFIMSANHPEKLDPAIVRPGRVDCTIHFKEFSTELVKKFINSFFRSSAFLPNDFFDSNYQELHHKFCPSKLFELCIESNENPSKLKKLLLDNESTVTESSNT